jgi:hypothetical protein
MTCLQKTSKSICVLVMQFLRIKIPQNYAPLIGDPQITSPKLWYLSNQEIKFPSSLFRVVHKTYYYVKCLTTNDAIEKRILIFLYA